MSMWFLTEQAVLRWKPWKKRFSIGDRSAGSAPACTETVGNFGFRNAEFGFRGQVDLSVFTKSEFRIPKSEVSSRMHVAADHAAFFGDVILEFFAILVDHRFDRHSARIA